MRARRHRGRLIAAAAAAILALAVPAAAHAFTVVGTESGGNWWSKDTVVQFDQGEVWTLFDWYGNETMSGIGGTLALANLHEGDWNLESGPVTDPTQLFSFGLDFTPPTSGSLDCTLSASGWCTSGFTESPLPSDPLGPSADHDSGVNHSEFSVDGGTSWTPFNPATPTVFAQGRYTVDWRAVDDAGNVETARSAPVQVDTAPPAANVSLSGPLGLNGWYTGPVTVTMSPSDPSPGSGVASTQYTLTGDTGAGPVENYTAPFLLSTQGDNYVNTYVWDVAGNQSYTRVPVSIDSTPPVAYLDCCTPESTTYQNWYRDGVVAQVSAQDYSTGEPSGVDHAEVGWSASGMGYVPLNTDFTVTGDGPTTISYTAVDKAGNAAPVQTQVVDIDSEPPRSTFTFSGATYDNATGWWIGAPVSVTATATDPNGSGVALIDVCRDSSCGPYFGSQAGPFVVQDDVATFSALATDNVGHVEAPSASNQVTVKNDPYPPTGSLSLQGTPGQNGWYVSPVTVTVVNAGDTGSGLAADPFHYQLFHGNRTLFDGTYEDTNEGDTIFDADISDVAGNVTHLPEQDLRIDTRPPDAILQGFGSQGGGGWDTYAEIDGLYATDPYPGSGVAGSGTFSLDGGPFVPLDQLPGYDVGDGDFPVPDGTHTISWRVTDNAGNVTEGSKTYTVDSTPPDLTCGTTTPTVWPTDGSMVPVSVDVSVSDALSGPSPAGYSLEQVSSNLDFDAQAAGEAAGWDVGTADATGEVAALPGRTYSLVYVAQDVAGNEASCVVQVTVPGASGPAIMTGDLTLPDGTPLTIDVRRDATGLIGGAGVSYGSEQSTGIDDVELLGHNGYVEGTFDDGAGFQLLLHDGTPDEIRLIDDDGVDTGWVVPASGDLRVTQDTTPPVMTLPASPVTADATSPAGATVPYTVTAKDDFDPSPSVSCSPASGSLFPVGDTTVDCTATDASGNASHGSFTVHVEGAGEQLADLLQHAEKEKLGPGFSLPAKLRAAIETLAPGHPRLTCLALGALDHELRAQAGKKISAADAASVEADVARIETVLGC